MSWKGYANDRPEVNIDPTKERPKAAICAEIGEKLGNQDKFFQRSNLVYRIVESKLESTKIDPVEAEAFETGLDEFITPVSFDKTEDTKRKAAKVASETAGIPYIEPKAPCTKYAMDIGLAKRLVKSQDFKDELPKCRAIFDCPMLIWQGESFKIITSYDKESGIWCKGGKLPDISLEDAVKNIRLMLEDFLFVDKDADLARAIMQLLTPALYFSGALDGARVPIAVTEANASQAGKGFLNQLIEAVYNAMFGRFSFDADGGGLGSPMETFSSFLISGYTFIMMDNIRGRIKESKLESFATEPVFYARKLRSDAIIDPRDSYIMMTSNAAQMNVDLLNRSNITRIEKQPNNYPYAKFDKNGKNPQGSLDILQYIKLDPTVMQASMMKVLQEWANRGRKGTECAKDMKTFNKWATTGNWIIQEIFGLDVDLLKDYDLIGERISSSSMSRLRTVGNILRFENQLGKEITSIDILSMALRDEDYAVDLGVDFDKDDVSKSFGKLMSNSFKRARLMQGKGRDEPIALRVEGFIAIQWAVETEGFGDRPGRKIWYKFVMADHFTDSDMPKWEGTLGNGETQDEFF